MSRIDKAKYRKHDKRSSKRYNLDVNMKGFLCSCNNREKDCIREAYNLLNKYADKLYPVPHQSLKQGPGKDVVDDLKEELAELKSSATQEKRFQVVESGARNFLFIKTTINDPVKLAESIVKDIDTSKTQQTKFLLRLIPIELTCKAYMKDITTTFTLLSDKYFKDRSLTFSVVYNHRNNDSLNRDEMIKTIAQIVFQAGAENKVDLKSPEVSIVIEVIRSIALLAVVPGFFKYRKYNLIAIAEQSERPSKSVKEMKMKEEDNIDKEDSSQIEMEADESKETRASEK